MAKICLIGLAMLTVALGAASCSPSGLNFTDTPPAYEHG